MLETYRLRSSELVLVFLDISDEDHLERVGSALLSAGATSSTRRTFQFGPKTGVKPEEVSDLVKSLEDGDCVTVAFERDGAMRSLLIVPPRVAVETPRTELSK